MRDHINAIEVTVAPSGRRFVMTLYRPIDYVGPWRLVMTDEQSYRARLERLRALVQNVSFAMRALVDELQTQLVDEALGTTAVATDLVKTPAPASGDARLWDTSEEALDEYSAEQLVALRADHRADNHEPIGCTVCGTLERRLGSL